MPIVYADHIESPLARKWKAPQILAHHRGDLAALVTVDCRFAGFYITSGPRLHLDKAENIVFPSDEVDFSPAARRTKISRHHCVAQPAEIKVSRFLAAPASAQVGRAVFCRQSMLRQPIEKAKRGLSRDSGKCAKREHWDARSTVVVGVSCPM